MALRNLPRRRRTVVLIPLLYGLLVPPSSTVAQLSWRPGLQAPAGKVYWFLIDSGSLRGGASIALSTSLYYLLAKSISVWYLI